MSFFKLCYRLVVVNVGITLVIVNHLHSKRIEELESRQHVTDSHIKHLVFQVAGDESEHFFMNSNNNLPTFWRTISN